MSEYQYYEFQAIDRPLTAKEMRELRACSTRARITPTSFVNHYEWGNFKGDEDAWMEKYFDAFLYLANWGTRVVKLRVSARLLDAKTARLYCVGESAVAREKNGKVILTFVSNDEEVGDWDDGDGWLSSMISVRAELARGDLRCLYLGWLLCAQSGELDGRGAEPPVPAGLAQLSASLCGFADFLRIDPDLLLAVTEASARMTIAAPKPAQIRTWLATMPDTEKDGLLARAIAGKDDLVVNGLRQRLARERTGRGQPAPVLSVKRRTVGTLLREAERARRERRRTAAKRAAQESARRAREAAVSRARHLDKIAGRESTLWSRVESLIATRQPNGYKQAISLLVDLRDLARRRKGGNFRRRLKALRSEHAGKPAFIERLRSARL